MTGDVPRPAHVARVAAHLGLEVTAGLNGRLSGAWKVHRPDGRTAVLKCTHGPGPDPASIAERVARLRVAGVAVPEILGSGTIGGVRWTLQEFVDHATSAPPDALTAQALLRLADACRGYPTPDDRGWWQRLLRRMSQGQPPWIDIGRIAAMGPAGAAVVDRCAAAAAASRALVQPQVRRLGHRDLVPSNVLRSGDRTWVIDWDHSGPVAAGYDLATFGIWVQATQPGPAGEQALAAAHEHASREHVSAYAHHASLWCCESLLDASQLRRSATLARLHGLLDDLTQP